MNFKKVGLPILLSSVLLTGCQTSGSVPQVDGKDVVASLTDYNIFADDIFTEIADTTNGETAYYAVVIQTIINKYYPVTEDMTKDAQIATDSILASYESSYGDLAEEYLNQALAYYGYESMDDYRDALISQYQYIAYLQDYIDANLDEVYLDYFELTKPKVASVITISVENSDSLTDEEQALMDEIDAKIAAGEDFATLAEQYSQDSTATAGGYLGVVDANTDLATSYGADAGDVTGLTAGQTSGWVANSTMISIFHCDSDNADEIKKLVVDAGMDSPLLSYDSYLEYLAFQTYDIVYNDEHAQELIENMIADAMDARTAERGEN